MTGNSVPQVSDEIIRGEGLNLAAAAKVFPAARGNGRVSVVSVWRWITQGAKAAHGGIVKLEAARLGGHWLTSQPALKRLVERLTVNHTDAPIGDIKPTSPGGRLVAVERASARLAAAGA